MPGDTKLNPQIADLEIGIRNLRNIKIYPLSLGDQLEMTDLITATAQKFFASRDEIEGKDDMKFVQFFVDLLKDNLKRILGLITDEEDVLKEISNVQAVELASLIYTMNYEDSLKNAQSLFKKIQPLFQLKGLSQPSASDTDTD